MKEQIAKIIELKCWPEYFHAILDGTKTFELRKNNRNYRIGDTLLLREYDPDSDLFTGRTTNVKVTYILHDLPTGWGLDLKDYIIMGIQSLASTTDEELREEIADIIPSPCGACSYVDKHQLCLDKNPDGKLCEGRYEYADQILAKVQAVYEARILQLRVDNEALENIRQDYFKEIQKLKTEVEQTKQEAAESSRALQELARQDGHRHGKDEERREVMEKIKKLDNPFNPNLPHSNPISNRENGEYRGFEYFRQQLLQEMEG